MCLLHKEWRISSLREELFDRTNTSLLFDMKYLTQLGPEHAWSWVVGVYSLTLWAFRRTGSNQESETVDWWFAVLVWVVNSAQWHESSRGMTGMRRWYLPCWQYSALVLLCSDSGISPTVTLVYLDSHDSYQTQSKKKKGMYSCASPSCDPPHTTGTKSDIQAAKDETFEF